jgi:hypothetical protein
MQIFTLGEGMAGVGRERKGGFQVPDVDERKGGAATQSDVCTTPPGYRPASTPFTLGAIG